MNIHKFYRSILDKIFAYICVFSTIIGIVILAILLIKVFYEASGWLNLKFLLNSPSRFASKTGIFPLIMGSFYLILLVALFAIPLGVFSAIYLEEYVIKGKKKVFIETIISNLAGVPSIVFGLLGLGIFIGLFGLGPGVLLSGALTLTIRILPIIIISTQEAIRSVPDSLREASYGLGASQWQTIKNVVIPFSLPSIMTGVILALANAIGETAPLIMIGVATSIFVAPSNIFSPFGALPLQIFAWSDFPKHDFQHGVVPAAIVVLLLILFVFNGIAIIIRNKFKQDL